MSHIANQLAPHRFGLFQSTCHLVKTTGQLAQLIKAGFRYAFSIMTISNMKAGPHHMAHRRNNPTGYKNTHNHRAQGSQTSCPQQRLSKGRAKVGKQIIGHALHTHLPPHHHLHTGHMPVKRGWNN